MKAFEFAATTTGQGRAWGSCVLALVLSLPCSVQAHRDNAASTLSAASTLPVALSVVAPVSVLAVSAVYTVKAVEVSATGAVWVLERASDGVQVSVRLSGEAAAGLSMAVGSSVQALACSVGWVLHTAGKAIAIVPHAQGQTLMYNEQLTR